MVNTILVVLLLTVIAGLGMILLLRERKRECINLYVILSFQPHKKAIR